MPRGKASDCVTRQRILDAARRLIAEHGFEATSTKAIAAEAGVPSGLLFYYFKTKDDLIEAIFDECPHAVEIALGIAASGSGALEVFLRTYYDVVLAHRYHIQIVVAAAASGHPIADKVRSWRSRSQMLIANFFRSQTAADLRADPEVLARAVTASIITAVLLEVPEDVSSFISGLTSFLECGLGRRPSGASIRQ
jgi:AcrR family transcriptional regulator